MRLPSVKTDEDKLGLMLEWSSHTSRIWLGMYQLPASHCWGIRTRFPGFSFSSALSAGSCKEYSEDLGENTYYRPFPSQGCPVTYRGLTWLGLFSNMDEFCAMALFLFNHIMKRLTEIQITNIPDTFIRQKNLRNYFLLTNFIYLLTMAFIKTVTFVILNVYIYIYTYPYIYIYMLIG